MSAPIIRPGRAGDAEACAAVHRAAALLAYRDIFRPDAAPPSIAELALDWVDVAWVAEVDGVVVGGVCVAPDADMPTGWLLSRLYVHPDHWGGGVGGELLGRATDSAFAAGAGGLNLWVLKPNQRARSIYERRGWRLVPGPTLANDGTDVLDVLYQLDRRAQA